MSVKKIESLNKHENPATNTNPFNIDAYLNDNWDKVKEVVDNNADELTVAQQDITDIKAKNTEQDSRIETNESKITELQTDNTTNKKDISDIKQKQTTQNANIEQNKSDIANINEEIATINEKDTAQDTSIETLTQRLNEKDNQIAELKAENEDLKADLSNSQIHGKASGEYVHLSDSAKMECSISPRGNSKQETRQGYNLLKNKAISQTTNGITATKNSDGSIKYSGICTQTFFMDIDEISLESGTYSLYGFSNGSNNSYMLISALQGIRTLAEQKDKPTPFTLTETLKVIFRVYIFEGAEINETLYPMLINGNDLTKPYEPYGAMPSIDYPSEIESVSSANVKVCNKNLFDKNNVTKLNAFITNNGTNISVQSNADTMIIVRIKPKTTYTVSKGLQKTTSANRLSLGTLPDYPNYEKELSVGLKNPNGITETSASITSKENDKYLVAHIYSQDAETTLNEILETVQIEENPTPTDYIPHEEQNYPVDMQEPFRAINDIRDCFVLKEDGKWYERHKILRKIFDGTEDIMNWWDTTNYYGFGYTSKNIKNSTSSNIKTEIKSNMFKIVSENTINNSSFEDNAIALWNTNNRFYGRINKTTIGGTTSSTDDELKMLLKAFLKSKYDAGTPIYVDYIAETPTDIECTETQTQQLQALQKAKTYKNITNITTDTIAVLDVDYKKDLETIINNINTAIVSLGGV